VDAGREARRLHIIFNNCYGNYGTTNAVEMAALLARSPELSEAFRPPPHGL
jgi:hypothetical protein